MKNVFVPYKVKEEAVEKAKAIIAQFISTIEANEPNTAFYKSFQQAEKPTEFVHIMSFLDEKAEKHHKKTSYCREFTDALYPLCEVLPKPMYYNEIN